jgi:hypothetical protein
MRRSPPFPSLHLEEEVMADDRADKAAAAVVAKGLGGLLKATAKAVVGGTKAATPKK